MVMHNDFRACPSFAKHCTAGPCLIATPGSTSKVLGMMIHSRRIMVMVVIVVQVAMLMMVSRSVLTVVSRNHLALLIHILFPGHIFGEWNVKLVLLAQALTLLLVSVS